MTYHQERLAECAGAFPQDFIGTKWDDVAQREDEWVDVFHVEVIGSNGIGDGVLCKHLWLLDSVPETLHQQYNSRHMNISRLTVS